MVDRGLYIPSLEPEDPSAKLPMVRCSRDYGPQPAPVK
jgi:hypothetical protein